MHAAIPTGNEFISLPTIDARDGSIECASVILSRLDGLLEIVGQGDAPFLAARDLAGPAAPLRWRLQQDWIPCPSRGDAPGEGFVLVPPGQRFLVYRSPGAGPVRFELNIGRLFQTINVRHELPRWTCRVAPFNWSWTPGVVVDIHAGDLLLSLSVRCTGPGAYRVHADGQARELADGAEGIVTSAPFRLEVEPSDSRELVLGFGVSRVAARSADLECCRVEPEKWRGRATAWLDARALRVEGDPELSLKANRNGHFARFYAMGRAIDTGRTVSMTSRSHRYYVSAAYWDRDALLWLYPFLVRNDREHALELLRHAYGPQLEHAGIHSRRIGGQVLEHGFELDELCAPMLALATWHALHPDVPAWEERGVRDGLLDLLGRLRAWRCPGTGLYRTELMPTDDLVTGGRDILTYNNALLARTLSLLLPLVEKIAPREAAWMAETAASIPVAIRRHLVRDGVFQWACDAGGECEFYDEAAGSLMLLPSLGLCSVDDPVFVATRDALYNGAYPYLHPGPFSELGNRHTEGAPHPWVLSACNSILGGARREQGLDFLRRAPMDHGIACESVNVETGMPETGMHFGTCAGFVAHAIATGTCSYLAAIRERDAALQGVPVAIT